jgi:hypothetical protein
VLRCAARDAGRCASRPAPAAVHEADEQEDQAADGHGADRGRDPVEALAGAEGSGTATATGSGSYPIATSRVSGERRSWVVPTGTGFGS